MKKEKNKIKKFAKGFTLLELLVVVLIIGLLASIALPQYRKSVEKSQVAPILSLLRTLYQAQESYYLSNGVYANKFDQLDVDFPWQNTNEYFIYPSEVSDHRKNGQWIAEIRNASHGRHISIGRKEGKYAGTCFQIFLNPLDRRIKKGILFCGENIGSPYYFPEKEYCPKIFNTHVASTYPGATKLYKL